MDEGKLRTKKEFKNRLYNFVLSIIRFTNSLTKSTSNGIIIHQLIRSSTSIIGNYIEAQAASSRKDFTNYFQTCLKSAVESELWLELLKDTNSDKVREAEMLSQELHELSKIFGSSLLKLKGKK